MKAALRYLERLWIISGTVTLDAALPGQAVLRRLEKQAFGEGFDIESERLGHIWLRGDLARRLSSGFNPRWRSMFGFLSEGEIWITPSDDQGVEVLHYRLSYAVRTYAVFLIFSAFFSIARSMFGFSWPAIITDLIIFFLIVKIDHRRKASHLRDLFELAAKPNRNQRRSFGPVTG